jgi:hypothetical protein
MLSSRLLCALSSTALLLVCSLRLPSCQSFQVSRPLFTKPSSALHAVETPEKTKPSSSSSSSPPAVLDEKAQKFGLEVGLWESLKQKDGGASAKSLLKKYGIAYLATSIPLALLSFALCYTLVSQGVDVNALLTKIPFVNIETSATSETVGTLAMAYAAHKALSPIRFPPTVVLTPIVAQWIGKTPNDDTNDLNDSAEAKQK